MKSLRKQLYALGFRGDNLVDAFRQSLYYILRINTANEYQRKLKSYGFTPKEAKQFRMTLTSNHYYPLNLRLFTMHAVGGGPIYIERFKFLAKRAGVSRDDMMMLFNHLTDKEIRLIKKLVRSLYEGTTPTVEFVRKRCGKAILEAQKAVKGIVYRRLRFVTMFNGVSLEDLLGDVTARLIQQFYWGYRKAVDKHSIRYLVATAANTIKNIAHYYSATCRKGSTEQDSMGISHQIIVTASQLEPEDETMVNRYLQAPDTQPTPDKLVELDSTINFVIKQARTKKQYRFLSVLVGKYDPNFDAFLKQKNALREDETHIDLQDRIKPSSFINLIAQYVCVTRRAAISLTNKIRKSLIESGYVYGTQYAAA